MRIFLAAVDLVPAAIVLVPLFLILFWTVYERNVRKSALYCLFCLYLAVVFSLVGIPNVTYFRPEVNLNLLPFIGMIDDWKNGILNILLFVPLGMMMPILWNSFRTQKNTLHFGFGTSLAIELLQMLTFRATDVNDLITNTLGAYLGFLCTNFLLQKKPIKAVGRNNETAIVVSVVLLIMFFVYPFVSSALWDYILT